MFGQTPGPEGSLGGGFSSQRDGLKARESDPQSDEAMLRFSIGRWI
jgi:hypothetical protein